MSETPTTEEKQPQPSPEGDLKKDAPKRTLRPELKERLRQRKPIRDYGMRVVLGAVCFLAFMLVYFVYTSYTTSIPHRTEYLPPPTPEMYPVDRLLSATDVKVLSEDGGRAEITYGFAETAPNRTLMDKVLKDWRGARRTLEQMRRGLPPHAKYRLEADTGLPLTPLLSVVSFVGDLEYSVEFEPLRESHVWFFFHYIYDFEVTGTALVVDRDGMAQFVRYRRELAFDDPRGKPGAFKLKVGEKRTLRIVVKEFPMRIGFRCIAYDGDREVTRADFPPEWVEDRRYHPTETNRQLVADFEQPPQAGFVAVISNPPLGLRLDEIRVVGRVADAWRVQRTITRKVYEEVMKPAEKPAEPDDAEKPEAKGEAPPETPAADDASKAPPSPDTPD